MWKLPEYVNASRDDMPATGSNAPEGQHCEDDTDQLQRLSVLIAGMAQLGALAPFVDILQCIRR